MEGEAGGHTLGFRTQRTSSICKWPQLMPESQRQIPAEEAGEWSLEHCLGKV